MQTPGPHQKKPPPPPPQRKMTPMAQYYEAHNRCWNYIQERKGNELKGFKEICHDDLKICAEHYGLYFLLMELYVIRWNQGRTDKDFLKPPKHDYEKWETKHRKRLYGF